MRSLNPLPAPPLKRGALNIIGSGHLGSTLGKLLHDNHLVQIQGICNQTLESAQAAAKAIGAGNPIPNFQDLLRADLTLLAVPDKKIEILCRAWVQTPAAVPGSILFHASGALSSAVLQSARDKGIHVASVHPLKSFANLEQAYQTFSGTFCAIEGDPEALSILCPLFEALGADLGLISPESKAQYHAACVMACGGLTALYATCQDLLIGSGVPADMVRALLGSYMKQTLDNNTTLGSSQALTGPIARGDLETVWAHQMALNGAGERVQELYRVLSKIQEDLL